MINILVADTVTRRTDAMVNATNSSLPEGGCDMIYTIGSAWQDGNAGSQRCPPTASGS